MNKGYKVRIFSELKSKNLAKKYFFNFDFDSKLYFFEAKLVPNL